MQIPEDEDGRKFTCDWPDCRKRFLRKTDVTRHMRIHLNFRPYKCSWDGCSKAFMQKTHTGEKPNRCPFEGCNKTFNDTSSLARHRRTHYHDTPFPCPASGCGQLFASRKDLLKHQRASHEDESLNYTKQSPESTENDNNTNDEHLNFLPKSFPSFNSLFPLSRTYNDKQDIQDQFNFFDATYNFNEPNFGKLGVLTPCDTPIMKVYKDQDLSPPAHSLSRLVTSFQPSFDPHFMSAPFDGSGNPIPNAPMSAPLNGTTFFPIISQSNHSYHADDFFPGNSNLISRRSSAFYLPKTDEVDF